MRESNGSPTSSRKRSNWGTLLFSGGELFPEKKARKGGTRPIYTSKKGVKNDYSVQKEMGREPEGNG